MFFPDVRPENFTISLPNHYANFTQVWYSSIVTFTAEQMELLRLSGSWRMDFAGWEPTRRVRKACPDLTPRPERDDVRLGRMVARAKINQRDRRRRAPVPGFVPKRVPEWSDSGDMTWLAGFWLLTRAGVVMVAFWQCCVHYGFLMWCALSALGLDWRAGSTGSGPAAPGRRRLPRVYLRILLIVIRCLFLLILLHSSPCIFNLLLIVIRSLFSSILHSPLQHAADAAAPFAPCPAAGPDPVDPARRRRLVEARVHQPRLTSADHYDELTIQKPSTPTDECWPLRRADHPGHINPDWRVLTITTSWPSRTHQPRLTSADRYDVLTIQKPSTPTDECWPLRRTDHPVRINPDWRVLTVTTCWPSKIHQHRLTSAGWSRYPCGVCLLSMVVICS